MSYRCIRRCRKPKHQPGRRLVGYVGRRRREWWPRRGKWRQPRTYQLPGGKVGRFWRCTDTYRRKISVLDSDQDIQSRLSISSFSTWSGLEFELVTQITFEQLLIWREYGWPSSSAPGDDHLCLALLQAFSS